MRARYAKAKLGFGSILIIILLSCVLILSIIMSVMLFIEPDDYPEKLLNCTTVEEVRDINGYNHIVNAVEYLVKKEMMQGSDINNINSISYVICNSYNGVDVDLCVEYTSQCGKNTSYISVREYTITEYSFIFGKEIHNHHYDIEMSTEEEYNYAQKRWLHAHTKDESYARLEKIFNEFAIEKVWEEVNMKILEEAT